VTEGVPVREEEGRKTEIKEGREGSIGGGTCSIVSRGIDAPEKNTH